jgi:hypothetical protein
MKHNSENMSIGSLALRSASELKGFPIVAAAPIPLASGEYSDRHAGGCCAANGSVKVGADGNR